MCEHGFYEEQDETRATRAADEVGIMDFIRLTSARIMKPPTPKPKIGLVNTKKLCCLTAALFVVNLFVLWIEIVRFRKRKRGKRRVRKKVKVLTSS